MPKRRRRILFWFAAAFLFLGIADCTKRESPEARVRSLLEQAEQAAEKKDLAALRGYISERYRDDDGNDRRAIEGVLRFYFLRQQTIHLYTRIDEVTLPQPGQAQVVLFVGMAGRPVASAEELARLEADLFRFDFELAEEEGEWRVLRAKWRRGEVGDFVR
ncbi:MAG: hypothetical protein HY308_05230 [Gammaproteobacteria bacterium]|nr:hypothetical protein [Gammaproteobacteria bacterium]